MLQIHHLDCLKLVTPINDHVCGHCLLINDGQQLILVDTGIGVKDVLHPLERIGQPLIDMVGYRFDIKQTAFEQIKGLGLDPNGVKHCIITHLDNDHIGGLSDFPNATVHLGSEEMNNYLSGNVRYLKTPLEHQPNIKTYGKSDTYWFGFEARKVDTGTQTEIYLIPLFGHTHGHCGVAISVNNGWLFYVGDAYYMPIEFTQPDHPVHQLAQLRADDNAQRIVTLSKLQKFRETHPEIDMFGYHDIGEFSRYKEPVM